MATFTRMDNRADHAALALMGLGTPVRRTGSSVTLAATQANENGNNRSVFDVARTLAEGKRDPKGRTRREAPIEGGRLDVAVETHDMLARASATANGNNHYGPYDPGSASGLGNSLDYADWGCHGLGVLEGLNVVAEDLVDAALLGRTARDALMPAEPAGFTEARDLEDRRMRALARVALRMLADGAGSQAAVRDRLADFGAALAGEAYLAGL